MTLLDNRTLLFSLVFIGSVLFFFSLFVTRRKDKRTMLLYQLSNLAYISGFGLLLTQQFWPSFISIIVANMLILTSFSLFTYTSVKIFYIRTRFRFFSVVILITLLFFLFFTYGIPNTLYRILIISASVMAILILGVVKMHFYIKKRKREQSRYRISPLHILFFCNIYFYLSSLVFRMVYTVLMHFDIQSIFSLDLATTIIFLSTITYQVSMNLIIFLRISQSFESELVEKIDLMESSYYDMGEINNFFLNNQSDFHFGEIYPQIFSFIQKRFDVDLGGIYILDKESGELQLAYSTGLPEGLVRIFQSFPLNSDTVTGRAVIEQKPMINLLSDYPDNRFKEVLQSVGVIEIFSFPMLSPQGPVGAFSLAMKHSNQVLRNEVSFFMMISNQIGTILDNTEMVKRLSLLASSDPLTGCLNRRRFFERLDESLKRSQRYGRSLGFFVLDIDHFKQFNDHYGHAAGDLVLKHLVEVCHDVLRDTDVLGRYGGEEFTVFLDEAEHDDTIGIAERLRERIENDSLLIEGAPVRLTISIGTAQAREEDSSKSLFNRADKALYLAKEGGRNRVIPG